MSTTTNCVEIPPISFTIKNMQEYSMADKLGAFKNSGTIVVNKTNTPYALNSIEITYATSELEYTQNNEKKKYTITRLVSINNATFTNLNTFEPVPTQSIYIGGKKENAGTNETVKTVTIPETPSKTRVIYDIELLLGCRVGNKTLLSSRYVSAINIKYYDVTDPYSLKESGIVPLTVNPDNILKRHSILLHDFSYNFVGKMLSKFNLSYDDYGLGFPATNWEISTLKIDDSRIKFTNETKISEFMTTVRKCASWSWVNDTVAKKVAVKIADITSVSPTGDANYTINTKMPYGITINTGGRIWFSLMFFKNFKCIEKSGNDFIGQYSAGIVYGFEKDGNDIPKTGTVDISKLPELYIPLDPNIKGRYTPFCDSDKCQKDSDCGGLTPYCFNGKCANCVVDKNCPVDMYCSPESNICASTKQCQADDDCKSLGLKYCTDSSFGKRCGNCRNNNHKECAEFGNDFQCRIDNMCERADETVKQCNSDKDCPSNSTCNADKICVNGDECVDNGDCYCGYSCKNGKWIERPLPADCKSDNECPLGLVCNSNKCTIQYLLSKSQSQCGQNQILSGDECVPAISECKTKSDCPADFVCINNNCQIPKPATISRVSLILGDFLIWVIILFFILAFMVYKLFT